MLTLDGGNIGEVLEQQAIYIGATPREMVSVELEAWERGYEAACAAGPQALEEMAKIEAAAGQACEQALQVYIPLDVAGFREAYARMWCAGYYSAARGDKWSKAR